LNYAREHWTLADENPPVGLILCSEQDNKVAHYALEGLRNTVLAREYQLALPDERRLAKQIEETRHRLLESYNFFSSDDNYFSLSTTTIF